ncbi:MAG TPA: TIGR00266 family protein [Polyangiaceae bacterium]|nr:TIGR00266 family protein [Polyangiaceae bacterium]
MQIDIQYNPAHSLATVHLNAGESIRAEASAMVSMTRNIDVQTNAGHAAGGGFFGGLKRAVVGGESFFQNLYTARGYGAHVTLAPRLCGSMVVHEMNPAVDLFIQGSSYVAAPDSVRIDTEFQGFKGFLSGESLFFLKASGHGPVLMNAFGAIETRELDGELILDTGHLVAFTAGIEYSIGKASKGFIASYLSGEGLVLRLRGRGRLWIQSRNPSEFGRTVGRLLPPRES